MAEKKRLCSTNGGKFNRHQNGTCIWLKALTHLLVSLLITGVHGAYLHHSHIFPF